ncbi:ABC transporter ATP-binding protein [Paracraurococcus lichenis]|uniref:Glutathione import ATP-binding protein GsiA n=1 Tax=Paracraurococcus lichenis TaxID=3064888 RepID=A0ABT9E9K5_9PROT|nr:oligopeptide/dipeptide ABC transporter ATP-binding protein [Paracraurococcus sp. LOR1-02]MDO9712873.1 ATP-binding cassette domain-containing protein [Paracraurococcus sp. LOR1-02]
MPLLSAEDLHIHHATPGGTLRAVDGISLSIAPGETLGLVGESGCGKSTLARGLLRLAPVAAGRIEFAGQDITRLSAGALRPLRRQMQMVFQDPAAALNPRQTARALLETPLIAHGIGDRVERRRRVEAIAERVGLAVDSLDRFPHEFSGGQKQRIGLARALVLAPKLVVCDEPVSALDVSVQAQILNLLVDLRREFGLSYLFVSHDLGVVRWIADRVLVMYLGRIVESAPQDRLWARPQHPYTRALMASVPGGGRRRGAPIIGDLPSTIDPPQGCRFHPRCPLADARCRAESPVLRMVSPGHQVACHHAPVDAAAVIRVAEPALP